MRRLARLMDEAIRVPGTNLRFGWDSLLGLIPGVGDVATGVVSLYFIRQAMKLGVPASLISRMILNLVFDVAGGVVPVAGDLLDVAWKANKRNLALVESWLAQRDEKERGRVIDV